MWKPFSLFLQISNITRVCFIIGVCCTIWAVRFEDVAQGTRQLMCSLWFIWGNTYSDRKWLLIFIIFILFIILSRKGCNFLPKREPSDGDRFVNSRYFLFCPMSCFSRVDFSLTLFHPVRTAPTLTGESNEWNVNKGMNKQKQIKRKVTRCWKWNRPFYLENIHLKLL